MIDKPRHALAAALAACLLSVSCLSPRRPAAARLPAGGRIPEFWVEYEPYPNLSGLTGAVRPVPSYEGWTDERMRRDLERMRSAGFRGVLVAIRPQDIAREHVRSRCRRFYGLAAQAAPGLRLALLFTAGGGGERLSMPLQNVMNFFRYQRFGDLPNAIRLDGRAVLLLDANLIATGPYSGRDAYRRIGTEWPARPSWGEVPAAADRDGFTWVAAADNGGLRFSAPGILRKWSVPRSAGASLRRGIQQALDCKAAIICIHSWNNYADGSFIEENTYDSDAMLRTLRQIHKDLESPPGPPAPAAAAGRRP